MATIHEYKITGDVLRGNYKKTIAIEVGKDTLVFINKKNVRIEGNSLILGINDTHTYLKLTGKGQPEEKLTHLQVMQGLTQLGASLVGQTQAKTIFEELVQSLAK